MNTKKPNNDNSPNYHICLDTEQSERLKECLHAINKLDSYRNPSENLKRLEQADQPAKWLLTNEDQKKRADTYYPSIQSDNSEKLKNRILSFNIAPQNSLENYYKKINYAQSINKALARDWHKVYGDLHSGYLSALKEQLANKADDKESDERKFGQ